MSQPSANLTELDGGLGVLPPSSGKLLAVVGASSLGAINEPSTWRNPRAFAAAKGVGPGVEAAAHAMELYGKPVVFVRTGDAVAGDYGVIDETGVVGTAVITKTPATEPLDDYEVVVEIIVGGTTGTTGITWRWSVDDGRTWSAVQSLGTALVFALAGTGVSFTVGTGTTLIAGDTWSCTTTAPQWNDTEIATALDALKVSQVSWEIAEIVGPIDADAFTVIDGKVAGMAAAGKYRAWTGNVVIPGAAETEAAYLAAQSTAFASKASVHGMLCAGACNMVSSVTGRTQRRPVSYAIAAREAASSQEKNIANILHMGALKNVSIRDANGSPDEHDETANPGLADARFTTLRTWEGRQGVYVNEPLIFSATGSDFTLMAHRRVMNLALEILRAYFEERCSRPIRVDKTTGFILESEALEMESGANARLRAALLTTPKASNAYCVIARDENVLSTRTVSGEARIVPLAYPRTFEITVGFENPALQVQAAG